MLRRKLGRDYTENKRKRRGLYLKKKEKERKRGGNHTRKKRENGKMSNTYIYIEKGEERVGIVLGSRRGLCRGKGEGGQEDYVEGLC